MERSEEAVEIGDDVIFQTLQDEVVLLNMTTQKYFGLDDVGSRMWQLLLEYRRIDPVVDRLQLDYQVDEPTVRRDLTSFVRELAAVGLVKTGAWYTTQQQSVKSGGTNL